MKHVVFLLVCLLLFACAKPAVTREDCFAESPEPFTNCTGNLPTEKPEPLPAGNVPTVPPSLTVSSGENAAAGIYCTYSWIYPNVDGTASGVEACGMHPLESLSYLTPLVASGSTVMLDFDAQGLMLADLTVRGWDMALAGNYENDEQFFSPACTVSGTTATLTLPDGDGFVFEVQVHWNGTASGLVTYAFAVERAEQNS